MGGSDNLTYIYFLVPVKLREFLISLWKKNRVEFCLSNANNATVRCIFPNHIKVTGKPDHSPSLSISLSDRKPVFRCWSCHVSGRINSYLKEAGFPLWGDQTTDVRKEEEGLAELDYAFQEMEELLTKNGSTNVKLPKETQTWNGSWRKIRERFLKKLGAKYWLDPFDGTERILFPITTTQDSCVGYIAGKLDRKNTTTLKWRNSFGSWVKKHGLFPLCLFVGKQVNTICLVEGPYDAIRLNYFGIPALSFLGTANWSKEKEAVLLSFGVENVVLCTDGDSPGYACSRALYQKLKKRFKTVLVDLPEGTDPGDLHPEEVQTLENLCIKITDGKFSKNYFSL